jgi:PadR family transcriptional regulator, regulatory protein PadR
MTARKDNDFLNGVPELLLLRLLGRQPMHGYDLVQAIKLSTGGGLSFGEGSVYPVLHRLEADGAIRGTREAVNGRSRVVYRLTPAGVKRLSAAVANWERVTAAVTAVLKGGSDGSPALA